MGILFDASRTSMTHSRSHVGLNTGLRLCCISVALSTFVISRQSSKEDIDVVTLGPLLPPLTGKTRQSRRRGRGGDTSATGKGVVVGVETGAETLDRLLRHTLGAALYSDSEDGMDDPPSAGEDLLLAAEDLSPDIQTPLSPEENGLKCDTPEVPCVQQVTQRVDIVVQGEERQDATFQSADEFIPGNTPLVHHILWGDICISRDSYFEHILAKECSTRGDDSLDAARGESIFPNSERQSYNFAREDAGVTKDGIRSRAGATQRDLHDLGSETLSGPPRVNGHDSVQNDPHNIAVSEVISDEQECTAPAAENIARKAAEAWDRRDIGENNFESWTARDLATDGLTCSLEARIPVESYPLVDAPRVGASVSDEVLYELFMDGHDIDAVVDVSSPPVDISPLQAEFQRAISGSKADGTDPDAKEFSSLLHNEVCTLKAIARDLADGRGWPHSSENSAKDRIESLSGPGMEEHAVRETHEARTNPIQSSTDGNVVKLDGSSSKGSDPSMLTDPENILPWAREPATDKPSSWSFQARSRDARDEDKPTTPPINVFPANHLPHSDASREPLTILPVESDIEITNSQRMERSRSPRARPSFRFPQPTRSETVGDTNNYLPSQLSEVGLSLEEFADRGSRLLVDKHRVDDWLEGTDSTARSRDGLHGEEAGWWRRWSTEFMKWANETAGRWTSAAREKGAAVMKAAFKVCNEKANGIWESAIKEPARHTRAHIEESTRHIWHTTLGAVQEHLTDPIMAEAL